MQKYIKMIANLIIFLSYKIALYMLVIMCSYAALGYLLSGRVDSSFVSFIYLLMPVIQKEIITQDVKLSNGDILQLRIITENIKLQVPREQLLPMWRDVAYISNNRTEIVWDTGFNGIGRVSIQFTPGNKLKIDRIDNIWYVVGAVSDKYHITNKSCIATGVVYSGNCILAIDKNGFVRKDLYNKLHIDKIMAKGWVLSY